MVCTSTIIWSNLFVADLYLYLYTYWYFHPNNNLIQFVCGKLVTIPPTTPLLLVPAVIFHQMIWTSCNFPFFSPRQLLCGQQFHCAQSSEKTLDKNSIILKYFLAAQRNLHFFLRIFCGRRWQCIMRGSAACRLVLVRTSLAKISRLYILSIL